MSLKSKTNWQEYQLFKLSRYWNAPTGISYYKTAIIHQL